MEVDDGNRVVEHHFDLNITVTLEFGDPVPLIDNEIPDIYYDEDDLASDAVDNSPPYFEPSLEYFEAFVYSD